MSRWVARGLGFTQLASSGTLLVTERSSVETHMLDTPLANSQGRAAAVRRCLALHERGPPLPRTHHTGIHTQAASESRGAVPGEAPMGFRRFPLAALKPNATRRPYSSAKRCSRTNQLPRNNPGAPQCPSRHFINRLCNRSPYQRGESLQSIAASSQGQPSTKSTCTEYRAAQGETGRHTKLAISRQREQPGGASSRLLSTIGLSGPNSGVM